MGKKRGLNKYVNFDEDSDLEDLDDEDKPKIAA